MWVKRSVKRKVCNVWVLLVVVAFLGCHRRDGRVPVSGTVTIDGQAVACGLVNFQPAEGNPGGSSGAMLRAGKFEILADQGLLPGKYRITVQAFQKTGRMIDDGHVGKIPEWASVEHEQLGPIEVTAARRGVANHFDLRLVRKEEEGRAP